MKNVAFLLCMWRMSFAALRKSSCLLKLSRRPTIPISFPVAFGNWFLRIFDLDRFGLNASVSTASLMTVIFSCLIPTPSRLFFVLLEIAIIESTRFPLYL